MYFLPIILVLFVKTQTTLSTKHDFPDDFLFGVSTSAYQIEGGHDSRGETEFDYFQRSNPSRVVDSSNAQIACDSYHRYHEDIDLVSDLGVDFYRFSISWTRILPSGYPNEVNPDGIRYYNNLIDGLIAKNIQPVVTMYHADLPKPLYDLGGLTNPLISDFFEDYSRVLFENFGDRVKIWVTINRNLAGFGDAKSPPMLNQSGIGEYLFARTVLLAHAKTYHLYKKHFKEVQKGQIGFLVDGHWYEPSSDSLEDVEAAERAREFNLGLLANPIFGEGDFPKIVKDRVEKLSLEQGFFKSRLPRFSPEEISFIKGSSDFFAMNIYTSSLVKNNPQSDNEAYSYRNDIGGSIYQDPKWPTASSPWLKVVPWGLRNVLKWIKDKYGNPPIFIAENGFSDGGELDDQGRIDYLKQHLKIVLESVHEDGVQVKAYAVWSLLDNFEWIAGYTEKFGLYHVDFNDPSRKRTPKSSSRWYKRLVAERRLDDLNLSKTEL